jgi:hypothetical protein
MGNTVLGKHLVDGVDATFVPDFFKPAPKKFFVFCSHRLSFLQSLKNTAEMQSSAPSGS